MEVIIMKKNLFSILLVVVMTMALVACGSQPTNVSAPEATETVNEVVENSETVSDSEQATEADEPESSEVTSEPEQATEAPVDEVASTPDSEAVESEASEPETSEPEFTFTELNATKYAVQSVNVRSGPSTDFDKIGSLSTNQEITVNGVCDQTGWFRFDLNGTVAFVSNRYVSDSKVEVAPPANNNNGSGSAASNTGSTSGAFNEADFPTPYAIINKGGLNVYFVMGPDPDMNYNAREQCIATVGANLGIEMEYHGAGTYYRFNAEGAKGIPNANGVTGLFFPYYRSANGEWLGDSPETQEQVF